jgi:hypothetical protein
MYPSDKILTIIWYIISRIIKLAVVLLFITIIIMIIAIIIIILSAGTLIFPTVLFGVISSVVVTGYVIFYIAWDILDVLFKRMDPLYPKSLATDIGERFPGLNLIYKLTQITNNPFARMQQYSY